jgi:hypothetical protein
MDHFVKNARPQPFDVNFYAFTLNQTNSSLPALVLVGRSFYNITNVYLSSNNPSLFSLDKEYINPFYNSEKLSSTNIGFSGVDVTEYVDFSSEKYAVLNLPEIFQDSGFFDIIFQNEAGFGILSQDSRVPFTSSWVGATDIQRPCVSGIYINNTLSFIPINSFVTEQGLEFITENNIFFISEG